MGGKVDWADVSAASTVVCQTSCIFAQIFDTLLRSSLAIRCLPNSNNNKDKNLTMSHTSASSTNFLVPLVASSLAVVVGFQLLGPTVSKLLSHRSLQAKLQERSASSVNHEDGTVSGLYIHPVKSLRAVSLTSAKLDLKGFVGDRRLMIVYPLQLPAWKDTFDNMDVTHRFLSQRKCPSLARVSATLEENCVLLNYANHSLSVSLGVEPSTIPRKSLRASVWDDQVVVEDLGDEVAAFFQRIVDEDEHISSTGSSAMFQGVRLVLHALADRKTSPDWTPPTAMTSSWLGMSPPKVSLTDGFPLLIACEASLEELNRRLKQNNKDPIDMSRFRANIIIKGTKPFEEDYWKYIGIGDQIFAVVKPCPRCKQSCIDQHTGKVHSEPVETMKSFRALNADNKFDVFFAQNAVALNQSGSVALGDKVYILERGEPRYVSA